MLTVVKGSPVLVPENTVELMFYDCHDMTGLITRLVNAEKLKKCTAVCCYSIEYIVDHGQNDLSMLETIVLRFLMNLRMIFGEVVTPSTLTSLKIITVPSYEKSILRASLTATINLEEIRVRHRNSMKDLMIYGRKTTIIMQLRSSFQN